ncbi:MAG TPA: thioesterase family protein [Chitinophagaceae bacterium]|jgi:acyl-CoA thioesterase FadM|nr:thioesterase family protein [Chitinophagaceae bacterium]
MARIKIELPSTFPFTCQVPVRITDINYGGHVGNDTVLSIIHEARMQYFRQFGYSEMNFAGTGMIMANVAIEFKSELFYGDTVIASVAAVEFSKIGFEIVYKLEKGTEGSRKTVALAMTGMICYDYEKKKIVGVPEEARGKLAISN